MPRPQPLSPSWACEPRPGCDWARPTAHADRSEPLPSEFISAVQSLHVGRNRNFLQADAVFSVPLGSPIPFTRPPPGPGHLRRLRGRDTNFSLPQFRFKLLVALAPPEFSLMKMGSVCFLCDELRLSVSCPRSALASCARPCPPVPARARRLPWAPALPSPRLPQQHPPPLREALRSQLRSPSAPTVPQTHLHRSHFLIGQQLFYVSFCSLDEICSYLYSQHLPDCSKMFVQWPGDYVLL